MGSLLAVSPVEGPGCQFFKGSTVPVGHAIQPPATGGRALVLQLRWAVSELNGVTGGAAGVPRLAVRLDLTQRFLVPGGSRSRGR